MQIKPNLIFILAALIAGFCVLITANLNSAPSLRNGQPLQGSWVVDVTVQGSSQVIKALLTCTPNGEVVETPSIATAASAGHGGWIRLGSDEFSLTVVYLRRDDNGELIGTSKMSSSLRVNKNFTAGRGRFETKVFDLKGNPLGTFSGVVQAKRIEVEAFQKAPDHPPPPPRNEEKVGAPIENDARLEVSPSWLNGSANFQLADR
jgi:hypothetical protein